MAKGKSTWKYNKLLTARNNYYNIGGFFNKIAGNPDEKGTLTTGAFKGLSSAGSSLMSGAGQLVGQVGGAAIGGGLESGVGNVLSGLSGIAGAIPGPWGAVANAGLGLASGVTNKFFGSKMNTENIAKVEANINNLNSFQSNASDFDTLSQAWANAPAGMSFSNSFIGEDGVFSNTAKNKAEALRAQVEAGKTWVQNSLINNAENLSTAQMQNLLGNYAAFGGPLLYAKGGSIHIKPENRGKFTETKRRTGKTTEELTHSKNPLTRKRAVFAQNARKWKHAFGGDLLTHGANFDTGVTVVGNGGTHEENPYEGVPMGVDNEGIPNLVEEGEVIFNDYVFSNRLMVPKEVRKKYKLRGTRPLTFADAAKQLSQESEERPNDPISKAGLKANMEKLMLAQENIREKNNKNNEFSRGGKMGRLYAGLVTDPSSNKLRIGIPITPFEGTDPIYITGGGYNSGYNPEAPSVTGNIVNPDMPYVMTPPPIVNDLEGGPVLEQRIPTQIAQMSANESKTLRNSPKTDTSNGDSGLNSAPTWMRYIPAYASGIMSFTDAIGLTNKPDYSEADMVLEAARNAGTYNPVKFNPIGNYLGYTPFDREFYINQMNAQAGATRRALTNTSGGNRATAMAGILAADNNSLNQIGGLARQAEEYNLAQRQKVEEFNRATNMFNTEGALKADMANQEALLKMRDSYFKGTLSAAELRQRERQQSTAARSANLSNFINSLGDIGRENFARNMIVNDPSKYYTIDSSGNPHYKKAFDDLDEASQTYVIGDASKKAKNQSSKSKKARGGYLTVKNKGKHNG